MKSAAALALTGLGLGVLTGAVVVLGLKTATKPSAVSAAISVISVSADPASANSASAKSASADSTAATASPTGAAEPVWTEVKWPFLLDQWGVGTAYECAAADCGVKIDVFVRPKIGFCNCTLGVSDDTELERVSDTDLVSPKVRPLGPGLPVKVGWMHGRIRPYRVSEEDEKASGRLLSIAFNDECDAVAAIATVGDGDPAAFEQAVTAFLNTRPMVLSIKKELGLEYVRRDW
jgi:hypothetical protein